LKSINLKTDSVFRLLEDQV